MWFFSTKLYALRSFSVTEARKEFGSGVAFGAWMYKLNGLVMTAFIIKNFVDKEWLRPFIYLGLGLIVCAIIGKLLVKINAYSMPPQVPPLFIKIYSLILIFIFYALAMHELNYSHK